MPPCDNPTPWNQLKVGTKYQVYPKAENGNDLILTGWFVGRQNVVVAGHDEWDELGIESYKALFREDAPHQPGAAMDANGEYSEVWLKYGPQVVGQRFCDADDLADAMGNMQIAPRNAAIGAEDEEMNGGRRRRKRGKKTRKPKRRARKTKRSSK